MISKEQLIGSWKLISFEVGKAGELRPWGEGVSGSLIYSRDDYMAASINRKREGDWSLENCLFYSGRFEIKNDQVHHYVENATDPTKIGQDLMRDVELSGRRITLSGSSRSGNQFKLIWERMN